MQCIFWMIQCRAQNHKENRTDQKAKLQWQKTDQWVGQGLCLTTKRKKEKFWSTGNFPYLDFGGGSMTVHIAQN